jgi:hypothetical protein
MGFNSAFKGLKEMGGVDLHVKINKLLMMWSLVVVVAVSHDVVIMRT